MRSQADAAEDIARLSDEAESAARRAHSNGNAGWVPFVSTPDSYKVVVAIHPRTTAQPVGDDQPQAVAVSQSIASNDKRFKGATPLQSVKPTVSQPTTALAFGTLGCNGPAYNKKLRPATFGDAYERESYYSEAAALADVVAPSWAGPQPEGASLTCKLRLYNHQQHIPHAALVISARWVENKTDMRSKIEIGFDAHNLECPFICKKLESSEDIFKNSAFSTIAKEDLLDWVEGEPDDGNYYRITALYSGEPYANNLFTDQDFGPLTETVEGIRDRLLGPCDIHIIYDSASIVRTIDALNKAIGRARRVDPLFAHYPVDPHGRHYLRGGYYLAADKRPKYAIPARINFRNELEYVAVQGYSCIQEHEHTRRVGPVKDKIQTRFMRIPGAGSRRLYAFFSDHDPERPLSLQSGDVLKVRIRKLNPNNVSDLYWDGEVVDRTSFAGLTDVCAIITCPYDDDDECWQEPNLTPLGVLPSFGAYPDVKAAMNALHKAKVSLVDIRQELDKKQFDRQMNSLDALQQQFAWEKANDPNGRSCTADLLFCNRFDHLPLVDLYEGVDEAAVDAIQHSLNDGQRQALSLCRRMRGGVAIVQGPPGTGKTFLLRTLLEPFFSAITTTHPAVVVDEPTAVVDEPRIAAELSAISIAAFRDELKGAADSITADNIAVILEKLKNAADRMITDKDVADKITAGLSAVTMEGPNGAADKANTDSSAVMEESKNVADDINTDPSAVNMKELKNATARGRKILIVSPINKNVDDLAKHVRETLTKHKPDVMVIRVYSEGTEKAIINTVFSGRAATEPLVIDADEALAETGVMSEATKMMYNEYNAATTRSIEGVKDKRVTLTELEHSLGMNMSRLGGIIPTHGVPPPTKYSELRNLYFRSRDPDQDMERAVSARLDELMAVLHADCLEKADVVCMTLSQASDPSVYREFKPDIIAVDEAGKVPPADLNGIMACYSACHRRLLFGDTKQSGSQMRSPLTENGFALQGFVSDFSRLIAAGFPTSQLTVQKRATGDIGRMVSVLFYDGHLVTPPEMSEHPESQRFRELFPESRKKNVILMNVRNSQEQRNASGSKYNKTTAVAVWDMISRLVLRKGYRTSSLAIIVPYTAQLVLHQRIRAGLTADKEADSAREWEKVEIITMEKSQGLEWDVGLVDLAISDTVGFLNQATRLNTGLSRARHGLLIFADTSNIERERYVRNTILAKLLSYLRKEAQVIQWREEKGGSRFRQFIPDAAGRPVVHIDDDLDNYPNILDVVRQAE